MSKIDKSKREREEKERGGENKREKERGKREGEREKLLKTYPS